MTIQWQCDKYSMKLIVQRTTEQLTASTKLDQIPTRYPGNINHIVRFILL